MKILLFIMVIINLVSCEDTKLIESQSMCIEDIPNYPIYTD